MRNFVLNLIVPIAITGLFLIQLTPNHNNLALSAVIMAWWAVASHYVTGLLKRFIFIPITVLNRFPKLFICLSILFPFVIFLIWIISFQPAVGISLSLSEVVFLVGYLYWFLSYIFPNISVTELNHFSKSWISNLTVFAATLLFSIVAIELGLRYFVVMSDNFALSKMHQNWHRLHWKPINHLGFRDFEPNTDKTKDQIIVMGDSFAVGYGINDIENTFPHRLSQLLGDKYAVNVVGAPGVGTGTAFADVRKYPAFPKTLIVSYYINDLIEGDAKQALPPFSSVLTAPSPELKWLVENLYIFNFYYYRIYYYFFSQGGESYSEYIAQAYKNPEALRLHRENELDLLVEWCRLNDVNLYIVVWFNLVDLDGSKKMLEPILSYFEEKGIAWLDTSTILSSIPSHDRVVNIWDAHPSVLAHTIIADELYKILTQQP